MCNHIWPFSRSVHARKTALARIVILGVACSGLAHANLLPLVFDGNAEDIFYAGGSAPVLGSGGGEITVEQTSVIPLTTAMGALAISMGSGPRR